MKPISTAGAQLPRTTSGSFEWPGTRDQQDKFPLALEVILLLAVGVLAAVLHQSLRIPLRMPGYHGMEWFALLILARLLSNRSSAGMVVGLGAATKAFVYAGSIGLDGKSAQMLTYLLQGCIVDVLLFRSRSPLPWFVWLPAVGAITHMIAPLTRNVFSGISAGTIEFGSLIHGIGYPLATHALFGAIGASAGLLIYLGAASMRRR
ncbi:hypothetical protein [Oxalicibacterium faecigallinarum]|uniref:Uncharacterized protein n=1 Tax=Oxalicibacterium faecigallinarum TaxID=573741 RepID=A0A8J3F482_9BURK|nr:hypothetical protein [Oxalicibacterium faecigallinarum]GGI20860.1 hypothetical protein GCM10008066_26140 [Oxalicibacterium faecigallinarum]